MARIAISEGSQPSQASRDHAINRINKKKPAGRQIARPSTASKPRTMFHGFIVHLRR